MSYYSCYNRLQWLSHVSLNLLCKEAAVSISSCALNAKRPRFWARRLRSSVCGHRWAPTSKLLSECSTPMSISYTLSNANAAVSDGYLVSCRGLRMRRSRRGQFGDINFRQVKETTNISLTSVGFAQPPCWYLKKTKSFKVVLWICRSTAQIRSLHRSEGV
jgi:hypothetical protein